MLLLSGGRVGIDSGGGVDGGAAGARLLGEATGGVLRDRVLWWRSKWWLREERSRESALRTVLELANEGVSQTVEDGLPKGMMMRGYEEELEGDSLPFVEGTLRQTHSEYRFRLNTTNEQ